MASALRQAGLNTELYFGVGDRVGDQIRYALNRGIGYVVIVGPDEMTQGTATVRDLATRNQVTIPQAEVARTVQAWMTPRR
jgi:histidyl-tRNA synthetase